MKDWLAKNGSPISEDADVYLAETVMSSRAAARKQDFREDFVEPLVKKTQQAVVSQFEI